MAFQLSLCYKIVIVLRAHGCRFVLCCCMGRLFEYMFGLCYIAVGWLYDDKGSKNVCLSVDIVTVGTCSCAAFMVTLTTASNL